MAFNASPEPRGLRRGLALYAVCAGESRGRLVPEPGSPSRSPFQRDRDRIIHAAAFRRLAHKTQVFVHHEGDHYRTRLTHSIEVSQIARSLARALGLDEDLAEALALSHDLGHTPFGHTGEDALDDCLRAHGGFDHNAQALRIVTRLERRYAAFDGLNLSWETLEGLVKHNGPLFAPDGTPAPRWAARGVPRAILDYDALHPLELRTHASAEAQCAALADDIAYDAHDLDDGLRAGLLAFEDLGEVPFLAALLDEVAARHGPLDRPRRINELVRRVITRFVEDAIAESAARLTARAPADAAAVRGAGASVIAFSPAMAAADAAIKAFLFPRFYHHPEVLRVRAGAHAILRDLHARFLADPSLMPDGWGEGLDAAGEGTRARRVGDFIAGMTDRYAVAEHRRLFPATPSLR